METSAKTGMNAQELFVQAAKILYEDYSKYKNVKAKKEGEQLKPETEEEKQAKKGCCK
jgi:DNA-directed RNA polymerase alpha subunit